MAVDTTAIASLDKILKFRLESQRLKVQESLAMITAAGVKRAQDAEIAGMQIKMLESTNLSVMHSQSEKFMTTTGFNAWYNPEEDDWAETMVTDLTASPNIKSGVNVGGYGFSKSEANRIAGAVQQFYLKSPESILEIAEELNSKVALGKEDSFIKGFKSMGVFASGRKEDFKKQLDLISVTLSNRDKIYEERYEFGRGDFKIQRNIGMIPKTTPAAPVSGLEEDEEFDPEVAAANVEKLGVFGEQIQGILNDMETAKSTISQKKKTLRSLATQISAAKILQSKGMSLTETQSSLIRDEEEATRKIRDEIAELSKSIADKRAKGEALQRLNREEAIKAGRVKTAKILHFGIDPLEKFWIWNKTGIWVDDDILSSIPEESF